MPWAPGVPGRGPWAWRNLTRDFDFWPTLESIEISREEPTGLANLDCEVVLEGSNNGLVFIEEDECEATYRGVRIWAGHLNAVDDTKADEHGHPMVRLSGQDYTAKLDDALIRRRRKRKKERLRRRVRWILRNLRASIWELDGIDLSQLPGDNPFIEAYDYFGDSIREALEHVAGEARLSFYVDVDNIFRIFRTDSTPAPFSLDNGSPDYVSTFPFSEWHELRESTELGNAVLVEPEKRKHTVWRKDATSIAAYGRQERFISDGNLHRKAQARNMGDRTLAQSSTPDRDVELVCWEPGLIPGHTLSVYEAVWDNARNLIVESVTMRGVDPHDDEGEAYLRSEVGLTDKRRPRIHRSRGTRVGLNKEIRRRPGQTADTDPYILDSFGRVATGGEAEVGDALSATPTWWKIYWGRYPSSFDPDPPHAFTNTGADIPPTFESSSPIRYIEGTAGLTNTPYTGAPCGPGPGAYSGDLEQEQWVNLVEIPTKPADLLGVYVDVQMDSNGGGLGYLGGIVYVRDSAPAIGRSGTPVGVAAVGVTTTIFIPAAALPDEGGRLWVGVGPNWNPDYGQDYFCSTSFHAPVSTGANNSGRVAVINIANPRWAVTSDDIPDFGQTRDNPKAPWGRWDWEVVGIEGAPQYGMDGDSLYVTGDGGVGWAILGERENDDADYGFWSDLAFAVELQFSTDDVSGGSIEVTGLGEGESAIGRVDLAGTLTASGPSTSDSAAVPFSADSTWFAVFDTRSNKVRGKAWQGNEPANWDVTAAMDETEDDGDRLVLWLRSGPGQTIRVQRTRAMAGARDGQRVVKEFVGFADGLTRDFTTRSPFREGTLYVRVNGTNIAPVSQDGDEAEYRLPFWPSAGSPLRTTYIVDQGTGD